MREKGKEGYPKEIPLEGNLKLISRCKKNRLYTFNPKGKWNGYGYDRLPKVVVINSKEQEEKFNTIKEEVEKEQVIEKPALTEEEKMEKWANRLARLTDIDKEDALEIAIERLLAKETAINMLEKKQSSHYKYYRQKLIYKICKENPLRYIKDEEHADSILRESTKYSLPMQELEGENELFCS